VLAAVRVKCRAGLAAAAEAAQPLQRRRIAGAAAVFLSRQPDAGSLALRFDAALLVPGRFPRHIPDAWRLDLA